MFDLVVSNRDGKSANRSVNQSTGKIHGYDYGGAFFGSALSAGRSSIFEKDPEAVQSFIQSERGQKIIQKLKKWAFRGQTFSKVRHAQHASYC